MPVACVCMCASYGACRRLQRVRCACEFETVCGTSMVRYWVDRWLHIPMDWLYSMSFAPSRYRIRKLNINLYNDHTLDFNSTKMEHPEWRETWKKKKTLKKYRYDSSEKEVSKQQTKETNKKRLNHWIEWITHAIHYISVGVYVRRIVLKSNLKVINLHSGISPQKKQI